MKILKEKHTEVFRLSCLKTSSYTDDKLVDFCTSFRFGIMPETFVYSFLIMLMVLAT